MSYIEKNLMNDESVIYRTNLHWIVLILPIILLFLAIFSLISGEEGSLGASGFFILIAILTGIRQYKMFKTSVFAITNKRVLAKKGRKTLEILLTKVEAIQVIETGLSRTLGFGNVTVIGSGGTKNPFKYIVDPFEFRKRAREQIASAQDSK